MYLPRLSHLGSALLVGSLVFCGLVSSADAQTNGMSPQLSSPQSRAISNRYQPQIMRPRGMVTSRVVSQQQVEQPQTNQPESVVSPSPTPAAQNNNAAPSVDMMIPEGAYFEDGFVDGGYMEGDCGCTNGCCGGQVGCRGECGGLQSSSRWG